MPRFSAQSMTNRFRPRMDMGSPLSPARQTFSQGWLQTRPQAEGNGLSFMMMLKASLYLPWAIKAIYVEASCPMGQMYWQGAERISLQTRAGHFFCLMWYSYSSRKDLCLESLVFASV